MDLAKEWITTGNVPVKVGVLVSFVGIALLFNYAWDQELISIGLAFSIAGLIAIALLGVGWYFRNSQPVFALSLQGGGIGILYLTVFASFRLYGLLPAPVALGIAVALTICAGWLAVVQQARALAILGVVGGFLAPVLVSTGSGNHVALFTYYLILNVAILGIARFHSWRELNFIGFVFTFLIGTLWGQRYYRPAYFSTVEPFLVAHFLLYQAVAILFAIRQPPRLKGLVDGTLVFGTPVVVFALQAALLRDTEYGLAISAGIASAFYGALSVWLTTQHKKTLPLLRESYIALTIAFATIAIPLALDARWTAAAWAAEGAALVWVGTRQQGTLAKMAGCALLVLAGLSFLEDGWHDGAGIAILNGNLLGGLLISVSALASSRFLSVEERAPSWQNLIALALFLWGAIWWFGTGALEIEDRAASQHEPHLLTLLVAVSGLLCTFVANRHHWLLARHGSLAHLPLLVPVALVHLLNNEHPFKSWGVLAWGFAAAVQLKILWDYESQSARTAGRWHGITLVSISLLLMWETYWQVKDVPLSDIWARSATSLIPALIGAATVVALGRVAWPFNRHWQAYSGGAGVLVGLGLLIAAFMAIDDGGNPAPLSYIPVANPFDVATLVALGAGLMWVMKQTIEGPRERELAEFSIVCLGAAALLLTTLAIVRAVHHLSGIPWRLEALFDSVTVQTSLSIYWGALGVAGMVFGARRKHRTIWLTGAGLMALVVAKLFVVDLNDRETLAAIISFIGVALLLFVVGYFAPAPPSAKDAQSPPPQNEAAPPG